jgi:hypothetical protein
MAAVWVVAMAAVLAGAGTLTPAGACISESPSSMTANNDSVNIAVNGPDHSLT